MKHPPKQFTDDEAYKLMEEFIAGENGKSHKIPLELASEIIKS